jgi:hypothetical protein
MNTELISLSKAFTEHLYRIPDYQRGYSWGQKQLKDFWNDLDQLEPKRNHYTGVLTLETVPAETFEQWTDDLWIIEAKHYRPYYIVDGQQRLTTVIILIQCILERVNGSAMLNYDSTAEIRKRYISLSKDNGISHSYIFGYEKDNPSYEFLKNKIFLEKSDNHSPNEETVYTQNLSYAKTYFSEKIKEFSPAQLEEFYTKVTQHLLFNVFTISDDVDVFVAFETMNNRGKPLSHLELLKNRLIYLSTKIPDFSEGDGRHDKSKLRKTINECWKSAYHYLGKNKSRPLDDNTFLLIQFLLFFNVTLPKSEQYEDSDRIGVYMYQHQGRYKDYLLDEVFTSKRLLEHESQEGDSSLNPLTIKFIYEYSTDVKDTVEVYYKINNPSDTNFPDAEKIQLDRLRRLSTVASLQLLTAVYKSKATSDERLPLLIELERLRFFTSLKGYFFSGSYTEEDGALLAAGKLTIAAITEKYHKLNESFVKSKEFKDALRNFGKYGYYGWKEIRYFLYEYEQWLRAQSKTNREKLKWEEFIAEDFQSDYITVEHIYPQRANHPYWKENFKDYTIKQRNTLRNAIGNLVPLSRRKNSSLSNKPFSEKKGSASDKVGFSYGCYSENEVAHEADWTARQIGERTIRLLKFFEERWRLQIGSDADKLKFSGLEFLTKPGKLEREADTSDDNGSDSEE